MLLEVLKSIIEGKGEGMNDNQSRYEFLHNMNESLDNTHNHIRDIKILSKLIGNKYLPNTLDDESQQDILFKVNRANVLLIQATEALLDAYKIIIDKEKKENE